MDLRNTAVLFKSELRDSRAIVDNKSELVKWLALKDGPMTYDPIV